MEEPLVGDPLQAHLDAVVKAMFEGRVVPLPGAGVNFSRDGQRPATTLDRPSEAGEP